MIRALFKLVLVVVVIFAVAAFFLGYRLADNGVETPVSAERVVPDVDTQKARETGAKVGEAVATGAAHGSGTYGFFSCSKSTNEVSYAAQKFVRTVLGSNNIDSCNRT